MKLSHKINREIAKAFIIVMVIFVCVFFPWQAQKSQVVTKKLITLMQSFITKDNIPLANAIFEQRQRAINFRAKELLKIDGIKSVFVFDHSGQILSDDVNISPLEQRSPNFKAAAKKDLYTWTKGNSLWYLQAVTAFDETIGFILIEYSLADMNKKENLSILLFTGIIVVLIFILLLLTNRLINKIILIPVDKLILNMSQIEKGRYGSQIDPVTEDEIGQLAKRFNAMSSEIDVSYKKIERQNEQLFSTKNLLDGIINSMPSILITIDKDCRIKEWNAKAKKAWAFPVSDAKTKLLSEVFVFIDPLIDDIKKVLAGKKTRKFLKVEAMVDNTPRFFDLIVYPIVSQAVDDAVIIIDDITDLVHMETMMVQSEKMMSVGGLAAGMAHEINNPLSGMIQSSQVITNRMTKNLPANLVAAKELGVSMDIIRGYMEKRQIQKLLDAIQTSGDRAAQIVKNMLAFSRQSTSQIEACGMDTLLETTVELSENDYDLKKKFDFKGIDIIREYDSKAPKVACDENRIQQVFFNILKNGAEAMADEALQSKKHQFILRIKTEPDLVQIEIEDNGPGMKEDVQKRIFEPFYTTKEVGIGTGLGLSVSYFIITENHHGKMWVESNFGMGTKFVIQLPVMHYPFGVKNKNW